MATPELSASARSALLHRVPTAPIAAAGLIAGFGVADATGSRPLGGVVLVACGLACIAVWLRRDPPRVTVELTVTGLVAFVLSHVLGHVIGAWPSVVVVSAVTAGLCWWLSDARHLAAARVSR
ncbi:MAG TPA: hypothetical protein VE571_05225 [Solirubrobacteraceae bacterium]|nr:hypothetical protein [Solirubrobacteraceae bacterium]